MPRWCSACGQLVCTPCSQAAAASAGSSSTEAAGDVCVCQGERGDVHLCVVFLKQWAWGFFLPDQKVIAAVIQIAHKAFFIMCRYLHFAPI